MSLYKNVDRAQKMFYLKRKIKDLGRNTVSVVGLLIMLSAMALLVYFALPVLKSLPGKAADLIGFGEESVGNKPSTPDGQVPPENLSGPQAPGP